MGHILKLSDRHMSILVDNSSHGIDVHFCNLWMRPTSLLRAHSYCALVFYEYCMPLQHRRFGQTFVPICFLYFGKCFDCRFTVTNAIFYHNALLSRNAYFFQPKKTKRSTNSEIEHWLQYAIKCTLYNVDCSLPARTTCTCLRYQLTRCATRHQVIIPV